MFFNFHSVLALAGKGLLITDLTNHGLTDDGTLVIVPPSPIKQIKNRLFLKNQFNFKENQLTEVIFDKQICIEPQEKYESRLQFTKKVVESGFIIPEKESLIQIDLIDSCSIYENETTSFVP